MFLMQGAARLFFCVNVIPDDISKAISRAGFTPAAAGILACHVFTSGSCTLVINEDSTWTCHRQDLNSRRLCGFGYTVASLLGYLNSYDRVANR